MSNTSLFTKHRNKFGRQFFTSLGIPQGDALSPILFIFYLEVAFRYFKDLSSLTRWKDKLYIPVFADDTDFVILGQPTENEDGAKWNEEVLVYATLALQDCDLNINQEKTTNYVINGMNVKNDYKNITKKIGSDNSLNIKKLGSILSDSYDIQNRIRSANFAYYNLTKLWYGKHLTFGTKLRMYNSYVKSILLYNIGISGAAKALLEKLNITFNKHIRKMLGIRFPIVMKIYINYQKLIRYYMR